MRRADSGLTVLLAVAVVVVTTSVPSLGQGDAVGGSDTVGGGAAEMARAGEAPGRAANGAVRGTTVDASGGVLPGVTVTASTGDGRFLGSVVTDERGDFELGGLPTGPAVLVFHLDGFDRARLAVTVGTRQPGRAAPDSRIVQRMEMVALAESVVVRGDPPPAPPPPPRPSAEPVPDHDQAAVCGPSKADGPEPTLGTIRSRNDDETKGLFAAGDVLLIEGGTETGLAEGQNFIVRRRYPTALRHGRNLVVMGEHSSGLLQIVDVESQVSTGVVVYACDEMMRGDYLVPFAAEAPRLPDPPGAPDFDAAARILFADAGQPLGVTGRMMVFDRGGDDHVRVGQRLTLFRRSRFGDRRPLVIGQAVVVAVRPDSSTFRVEHAVDAVFFGESGDWAAPQRPERAGR